MDSEFLIAKMHLAILWIMLVCGCGINEGTHEQIALNTIVQARKQTRFASLKDVVRDEHSTPWFNRNDTIDPWSLQFNETEGSDTLWTTFAPECGCMFPMEVVNDTIVVFWAPQVDTKYDFKIVQAIHKLGHRYWNQPFLQLWLKNDTTLEARYPIDGLMSELEKAGDNKLRFPLEFHPIEDPD